MRIDHHARGDVKNRAQDYVGRLAADARKFDQPREILRHVAVIVFDQEAAAVLDVLRLVAEKARALDRFFQITDRRFRIVGRRAVFAGRGLW